MVAVPPPTLRSLKDKVKTNADRSLKIGFLFVVGFGTIKDTHYHSIEPGVSVKPHISLKANVAAL